MTIHRSTPNSNPADEFRRRNSINSITGNGAASRPAQAAPGPANGQDGPPPQPTPSVGVEWRHFQKTGPRGRSQRKTGTPLDNRLGWSAFTHTSKGVVLVFDVVFLWRPFFDKSFTALQTRWAANQNARCLQRRIF
jgi:hypothetical protein